MPTHPPYTLGVDLGGTNIHAGLLDAGHRILIRETAKTKAHHGSDEVIQRIVKLVNKVMDDAKVPRDQITALGIGAPGMIDPHRGVVIEAVNLRWRDFPLAKILSDQLRMKVVLDNDVNVGAWGEYQAGSAKGCDDFFSLFIGTGIGGALILGGELFHGPAFTAGEIGHTVIDADAPLGRRTLENLASRTSVVNQLIQLIRANHPSSLAPLVDGDKSKIRSKALAQAWREGDALTHEVLEQAARYVGIAVANVISMLSLRCVVLGGGLIEALGESWADHIRAAFRTHVAPAELADTQILISALGDDAGLVGAALLAQSAP